jgi:hypothetical protein
VRILFRGSRATERPDERSWNELKYIVLRGHTTNVAV